VKARFFDGYGSIKSGNYSTICLSNAKSTAHSKGIGHISLRRNFELFVKEYFRLKEKYVDAPGSHTNKFQCRFRFQFDNPVTLFDDVYRSILKIRGRTNLKLEAQKSKNTPDNDIEHCFIITGDRGSGKTEVMKKLVFFTVIVNRLTKYSRHSFYEGLEGPVSPIAKLEECERSFGLENMEQKNFFFGSPIEENEDEILERALRNSFSVLESFGCVTTVNNPSSSRFGSYVQLNYTPTKAILMDAKIQTFLLEKARITSALIDSSIDSSNFNIFYQFISAAHSGMNSSLVNKYHLHHSIEEFHILKQRKVGHDELQSLMTQYGQVLLSFKMLECTDMDIEHIQSLLAAIIHLGNVVHDEVDAATNYIRLTSSLIEIPALIQLLGLRSHYDLLNGLTAHRTLVGNGMASKKVEVRAVSANKVKSNIHSLMKYLYEKLFTWITRKANDFISLQPNNRASIQSTHIGFLDIFGFDASLNERNSLEQLCSNLTAERFLDVFYRQTVRQEELQLKREGIKCNLADILTEDAVNQHIVDVITKSPNGILNQLEEYERLSQIHDDLTLMSRLDSANDVTDVRKVFKSKSAYSKVRCGTHNFVVRHSRGDIMYSVEGFMEKNNCNISEEILEALSKSSNVVVIHDVLNEDVMDDFPMRSGRLSPMFSRKAVSSPSSSLSPKSAIVRQNLKSATTDLYGSSIQSAVKNTNQRRNTITRIVLNQSQASSYDDKKDTNLSLSIDDLTSDTVDLYDNKEKLSIVKNLSVKTDLCKSTLTKPRRLSLVDVNTADKSSPMSVTGNLRWNQQKKVEQSVSYQWRLKLDSLLSFLRDKELHFVKCITTCNDPTDSCSFDDEFVSRQLNSAGIIDSVMSSCRFESMGLYPVSFSYVNFLTSYCVFLSSDRRGNSFDYERDRCLEILNIALQKSQFKLGLSKVFLTSEGLQSINSKLNLALGKYASSIQSAFRRFVAYKRFRKIKINFIVLQSLFRMQQKRKKYLIIRYGFHLYQYPYESNEGLYFIKSFTLRVQHYIRLAVVIQAIQYYNSKVTYIASYWRRALAYRKKELRKQMVFRIQRFFRVFSPLLWFHNRMMKLHLLCRSNRDKSIIFAKGVYDNFPHEKGVRNKWLDYCSLLHSAAKGNNLDMIHYLQPKGEDVIATDICKRNTLHYAAFKPNMYVVRALAEALNCTPTSYYTPRDSNYYSRLSPIERPLKPISFDMVQSPAAVAGGGNFDILGINPVLLKGWVHKSSNCRNAKKKWFVVSNDYLSYSKSDESDPAKGSECKILSLKKCSVRRMSSSALPSNMFKEKKLIIEVESSSSLGFKSEKGSILKTLSEMGFNRGKGKIFLHFDDEATLLDWLRVLKRACLTTATTTHQSSSVSLSGSSTPPKDIRTTRSSTAVSEDICHIKPASLHVDMLSRTLWVTSLDVFNETPLHVIARHSLQPTTNSPRSSFSFIKPCDVNLIVMDVVKMVSWLIDHGCNVNEQNNGGQTALHLAVGYPNNEDLIACLILKGASVFQLRNRNRQSVFDLLCQPTVKERYEDVFRVNLAKRKAGWRSAKKPVANANEFHNLPNITLSRDEKYTYCSLFISNHSIDSKSRGACFDNPYLVLSLLSPRGELVEDKHEIRHPVLWRQRTCCWGTTICLLSPMESIVRDSYVLIEVFNRQAAMQPSASSLFTNTTTTALDVHGNSITFHDDTPSPSNDNQEANVDSIKTNINENANSQENEDTTEQQRNKYLNVKVGSARLPVSSLHTQFDLQLPFLQSLPTQNVNSAANKNSLLLHGLERELACHQSNINTSTTSFHHNESSSISIDISMFLR